MIRKRNSQTGSISRVEDWKMIARPGTGSLVINHEEEAIEDEPGVFEKFAAWDGETVERLRAFFGRNGAVVAYFEEPLRGTKDGARRRFAAISAAIAHLADFLEQQNRLGRWGPRGVFARWESSLVTE
ncbi:MAG: hypothetical protein KF691_01805 [Phycisphaeraceae bacterium]|nr:hypothetical protein [Phycisphaeraceae bacterium]